MIPRTLSRGARADTALSVGVGGGLLASLVGVLGYVVVPVLTGAQPSPVEASVLAAMTPSRYSVAYHAALLVLPPFLLAFGGSLFVRERGLAGWGTDAKVLGGIVLGPLVTVCVAFVATAIGVGLTLPSGGPGAPLDPSLVVVYTLWALLLGTVFLVVSLVGVGVVEGGSAAAGYLCALGVWRVAGRNGTPTDSTSSEGEAESARDRPD